MAVNTLTNLISALRFRLGNKTGREADFLREVQFAQQRLEDDPTLEYWFLVKLATLNVISGDRDVAVPLDFIREYDGIVPLLNVNSKQLALPRADFEEAVLSFQDAVGQPQCYAMYDERFVLFPIPDKAYTIDYNYLAREEDLVLTTNESNAWTKHAFQMLLNKAGIALAQSFRDKDALANFTADFQAAFSELLTRITQREEVNFHQSRGGDRDALRNRYNRSIDS